MDNIPVTDQQADYWKNVVNESSPLAEKTSLLLLNDDCIDVDVDTLHKLWCYFRVTNEECIGIYGRPPFNTILSKYEHEFYVDCELEKTFADFARLCLVCDALLTFIFENGKRLALKCLSTADRDIQQNFPSRFTAMKFINETESYKPGIDKRKFLTENKMCDAPREVITVIFSVVKD